MSVCTILFAKIGSSLIARPAVAQLDLCGPEQSAATAAQCLFTLRAALDLNSCEPECACDLDDSGSVTATDALLCLRHVVGVFEIGCPCPTCSSALLWLASGSEIDQGWNGRGHGQSLAAGVSVGVDFVRRCDQAPDIICTADSDCPQGRCSVACDCDEPAHSECELSGPTGQRHCVNDLTPCERNADCGSSICVHLFGPPLPLSASNTPVCLINYFANDLTGTYDAHTGHMSLSTFLRARVLFGLTDETPCPRCGPPALNPAIGDQFTCDGGLDDGKPCVVEAVSAVFGGASMACRPEIPRITGQGIALLLREVTTGTVESTATLPCVASNVCLDDLTSDCATNTDCARCTDDRSPCASNADCDTGTCAVAPDQPISCGFWCHCGFCDDNPGQPCMSDTECDLGETCTPGNSSVGRQENPNACDDFVCGGLEPERCCAEGEPGCETPTPLEGRCSEATWSACSTDPRDPSFGKCEAENAGVCVADNKRCFEPRIVRSGQPSPLGDHCVGDTDVASCTPDEDCDVGTCAGDTAAPKLAALFCTPLTAAPAINLSSGLPGPSTLALSTVLFVCRCGDHVAGCDEECDDGNDVAGDGCDASCRLE